MSGIVALPAIPGFAWLDAVLDAVLAFRLRFVLRWPGRYLLLGPHTHGVPTNAWRLVRGQRSWEQRLLWDARRHC